MKEIHLHAGRVRILHGEKSREKEKPGMETVRNLQEEGESVGVVGGKKKRRRDG